MTPQLPSSSFEMWIYEANVHNRNGLSEAFISYYPPPVILPRLQIGWTFCIKVLPWCPLFKEPNFEKIEFFSQFVSYSNESYFFWKYIAWAFSGTFFHHFLMIFRNFMKLWSWALFLGCGHFLQWSKGKKKWTVMLSKATAFLLISSDWRVVWLYFFFRP